MSSKPNTEGLGTTQSSVLSPQSFSHSPQNSFPGWTASFQAALERLKIASRRPARSQHAGDVRSRTRGRALEFADYRPYTPGDDPKLVDWRAYTRLGRLYLKQYEEERTRTLTLLIDASASLDWGDGETQKGQYARRLAAALAWISLGQQEPVRTFLLRDGATTALPPVLVRSGIAGFFASLGRVREGGRTDLAVVVREALVARTFGPVVLLSDLLDVSWPDALATLAATEEATVLHVLAPTEWEPPLGEEVELEDAETGERRATRLGPTELAAYRARLDDFLTQVRTQCNRLGIAHVALNTGTPLQHVLLRQLPAAGILQ